MTASTPLQRASRCLVGVDSGTGPLVVPLAAWYDGAHLWLADRDGLLAAALGDVSGDVMISVTGGEPGSSVMASGTARVFGLHDPFGLALHATPIAAAMTALELSSAESLLGTPGRWVASLPRAVRVQLDEIRPVAIEGGQVRRTPGEDRPAPALPTVVPAHVRRRLSGIRTVTVFCATVEGLNAWSAVWGSGFALSGGHLPPGGAPVAVVVDDDHVGLAIRGWLRPDGTVDARAADWWSQQTFQSAEMPPGAVGLSAIDLPE